MPSKAKEARLEQKSQTEVKLNERLALLAERGLGPQAAAKDRTIRKLRADLRKANERLQAIEGKEKQIEDLSRAKEEKNKEPKKEKDKKKSDEEVQPEVSKRQQKKLEKQKDKEKKKEDSDA